MGQEGRQTQIILLKQSSSSLTINTRLLHVTLLLCAVMALASAKCRKTCPAGWQQHNARCYKLVETEMTWADAEKHCLSLCGNLVSISDAGEDSFVHSLKKKNENLWIGGLDSVKEGLWLWSDGRKMVYTSWHQWTKAGVPVKEPNNFGPGGQQCLQMYGSGSGTGKWDDFQCTAKRASVCAKAL